MGGLSRARVCTRTQQFCTFCFHNLHKISHNKLSHNLLQRYYEQCLALLVKKGNKLSFLRGKKSSALDNSRGRLFLGQMGSL